MVGTRGGAATAPSNGGGDTSRANHSSSHSATGGAEKGGNPNSQTSLPAKRSLAQSAERIDAGTAGDHGDVPSSPGAQLGRAAAAAARTRSSNSRTAAGAGTANKGDAPPSPSRSTRAERASARASARERTSNGINNAINNANGNGGSSSSTSEVESPRGSKRAKLAHPSSSGPTSTKDDTDPQQPGGEAATTKSTAKTTTTRTSKAATETRDAAITIAATAAATAIANVTATATAPATSNKDKGDATTSQQQEQHQQQQQLRSDNIPAPVGRQGKGGGGTSTPPTPKSNSATSVAEIPSPSSSASKDDKHQQTGEVTGASSTAAQRPPSPPPPLKSLTMHHLRKKYLQELEYMSVEFRKLEKQLLGARGGAASGATGAGANAQPTESAASRERREKLHSFIVHLEDTIQQIKDGCLAETLQQQQQQQQAPVSASASAPASTTDGDGDVEMSTADDDGDDDDEAKRDFADSAALTKLTREKEQEETVQKLEEHILANLLPVKVRLTKQLAAQQGATRNPAGMPTSARGPRPSAAAMSGGKGTFAAAAEERRKREEAARSAAAQRRAMEEGGGQHDSTSSSTAGVAAAEESTTPPLQPPPAPSILGKPLKGGGSSLTARLHGSTLGSKARPAGHGVGQAQAAVQSPRAKESGMNKVASTTTEDSFDSTAGETGQPKRKILFAGMTPGSEQVSSSVSAAQGAHQMIVTDPTLRAAHKAGLASEAIEEGAGALASLASAKAPPPPPPPRGAKAKTGVVRPNHPGAPKPGLVASSGSDSSHDTIAARGASKGPASAAAAASRSAPVVPAGPASAAVAKVQAQQVATAAQLAARAKARAAAGLPPLDTPVTSSAAAELRRTGKKSTANRGKKRRLSEKNLTDEEKERLIRRRDRRQRRRKKAKRLERERIRHAAFAAQARHAQAQHSAAAAAAAAAAVAEHSKVDPSKPGSAGVNGVIKASGSPSSDKKAGPRTVEYICGLCNEVYVSTCDANPWWCLRQQDCPKCGKRQVPRIDISAPANAIQYHPALLAHAEDSSSGGSGGSASVALRTKGPVATAYISSAHLAPPPKFPDLSELYESSSEASDDDEAVSLGGESSDESDDDVELKTYNGNLSPAERAEAEDFGTDYAGPKLKDNEASRLLILMGHAQCCPGRHKVGKMREVCQNTKFMMMHVRDCPGTTSTFDVCPFPWCRKVKHLLHHLVSCEKPEECSICTPKDIPPTLKALRGLNAHRHKKHREKLKAAAAAAASVKASAASKARAPVPAPYANLKKGPPVVSKLPASKQQPPSKYPPPSRPGMVPNPTLASKSGAKVPATVAGRASAAQPRHPGAPRTAPTVTKTAVSAAKGSQYAAKPAGSKPTVAKHPGAPVNPLNKEVPVPLRGSTPNPILPSDSTDDSAPASKATATRSNIAPPTRPANKSTTPMPVSNPLAPTKVKTGAAVPTSKVPDVSEAKPTKTSSSVVVKEESSEKSSSPPAREATPPENNGCAGEAAAKASAESARLVEE